MDLQTFLEKVLDKGVNVEELVSDKEFLKTEINLAIPDDSTNYWLTDVEYSAKGSSGYPDEGEIRFIGEE